MIAKKITFNSYERKHYHKKSWGKVGHRKMRFVQMLISWCSWLAKPLLVSLDGDFANEF